MSTMGERIRQSREKKEILQSQLAKMIGVKSSGVISNWENDINKPDADKMVALCNALDISLSFLLDYYGPAEKSKKSPLSEESGLDESEQKLIRMFRELNQEGQELLVETADTMVSSGKYKKSGAAELGKAQDA